VSTLKDLHSLIPELKNLAKEHLADFGNKVRKNGGEFWAIPIDILIVLISIAKKDNLPEKFDWDSYYFLEIYSALEDFCKIKRPFFLRRKDKKKAKKKG
jgi:hypothetical protein